MEGFNEEVIVNALTNPKTIKLVASLIKNELTAKSKAAETEQSKIIERCIYFVEKDTLGAKAVKAKDIYVEIYKKLGETELPFTLNQFSRALTKQTKASSIKNGVKHYYIGFVKVDYTSEDVQNFVDSNVLEEAQKEEPTAKAEDTTSTVEKLETLTKKQLKKLPSEELDAYLAKCKELEPDSYDDLKAIIKKIKKKRKKNS